MMQPKDVVLAYVEAFNRGDLEGLCRLFSSDALVWGVIGWGSIDQARPVWKDLIECLGIRLQVDGIISEGNTVAVRYTERGRSIKAFRGAGPTGRTYELTAMEWFEVKDGLIHRRWGARDAASQSRQLGFTE
jgi:steroid delta-isomerase-like uncharacterized protein